jgi:hypothetical protein
MIQRGIVRLRLELFCYAWKVLWENVFARLEIKRISHNHALEYLAKYPRELYGSAKPRIRNPDFAQRGIQGREHH